MPQSEYDVYVRAEWELFHANASSAAIELDAVSDVNVKRVLDVGCGAGQMMAPFVARVGTLGVGVDVNEEVGQAGRQLFAAHDPRARIAFVRAQAEALPWRPETFDVVICRLALPYTDNVRALGEMARVLRPNGRLLLRIHHWRFYFNELMDALTTVKGRVVVNNLRILLAGTLYRMTGRQPRNRVVGTESFQTRSLLQRELARLGLVVTREMPDSTADTPSFVIAKDAVQRRGTG